MNQKPYNKCLINLVCLDCTGKYLLSVLFRKPCSFVVRSVRKPQANTFGIYSCLWENLFESGNYCCVFQVTLKMIPRIDYSKPRGNKATLEVQYVNFWGKIYRSACKEELLLIYIYIFKSKFSTRLFSLFGCVMKEFS